jgi:hypothetical protein
MTSRLILAIRACILACLLPATAAASTLTGYVLNALDQGVASLELTILDSRTQERILVSTDSRGLFRREMNEGEYDILEAGPSGDTLLARVNLAPEENRLIVIRVAEAASGPVLPPQGADSGQADSARSLAGIRDYQVRRKTGRVDTADQSEPLAAVVNPFPAQKKGRFHGSIYEFHRNDNFDARNFFDPVGEPLPEYKRNEFGFVLGFEPLKNLQLLGTCEGLRIIQGSTLVSHVPTPEMKKGDFSALPQQLIDPLSGLPLEGNRMPQDRISSVAQNMLAVIPDPNASDPDRNYINNQPFVLSRNGISSRVDYQLGDGSAIFARYAISDGDHLHVSPLPAFGATHAEDEQDVAISFNRKINSRLLSNLRFDFTRTTSEVTSPNAGKTGLLESIGIDGVSVDDPSQEGYPDFQLSGYASFGDGRVPLSAVNNRFSYEGGFTWTPESHTLQAGAGFVAYQANNASSDGVRRGRFAFNGYYSGDSFADFLFGVPDAATRGVGSDRSDLRRKSWYVYARDEWRIDPRLSLTAGVSYNYMPPFHSVHQNVSGFVPLLFEPPLDGKIVIAGTPEAEEAGLGPAGPGGMVFPDRNDWAPDFGIAYRPFGSNRLVMRGSYALRYGPPGRDYYVSYLGRNYPFYYTQSAISQVDQAEIDIADPFESTTLTQLGVRGIEPTLRTGYVQDWFCRIQGQVTRQWYLESGYEGTKSAHMPRVLPSNVPVPDTGVIDLRRPNPDYGQFSILTGGSSYTSHRMDVAMEHRFAEGYALKSGFIWASSIGDLYYGNPSNPRDLAAERAPSDWLPSRRFYLNYLFDLPFGRGGRIANGVGPWLDGLIGGWRLSGITSLQDGTRYNPILSGDYNNDGVSGDRPDRLGSGVLEDSERSVDQWFDIDDFAAQPAYTFGNAGRNILVGPSYANWDLSLIKQARFTDGSLVEFRVELFNAFNHANFELPYAVVETSSFGKIFGAHRAREIEVALRYSF